MFTSFLFFRAGVNLTLTLTYLRICIFLKIGKYFKRNKLEMSKKGDTQKGNSKERDVRMSNIVAAKGGDHLFIYSYG